MDKRRKPPTQEQRQAAKEMFEKASQQDQTTPTPKAPTPPSPQPEQAAMMALQRALKNFQAIQAKRQRKVTPPQNLAIARLDSKSQPIRVAQDVAAETIGDTIVVRFSLGFGNVGNNVNDRALAKQAEQLLLRLLKQQVGAQRHPRVAAKVAARIMAVEFKWTD